MMFTQSTIQAATERRIGGVFFLMFMQSTFYTAPATSSTIKSERRRSAIEKLKQFREGRGLTQAELGKKVGLSREAIASLETRDILPHADKLPALADALGVSIDQLMGYTPMIAQNGG